MGSLPDGVSGIPPYDGMFTSYTRDGGAKWMLSNFDTPFVRSLYRAFRVETLKAPRTVAAKAAPRTAAAEVIVRNH